jgi:hypothetical protein
VSILFRGARVGLPALAVAALAVGAAGCGSSGSTSSSAAATSAAAATTSAASSSAATSSAGATSTAAASSSAQGATAKPGASAKPGQAVTVGYSTTTKAGKPGPSYKLSVNITSIEKGSLSDFNGIKLDATEKASTPYYVKVSMTNLGPGKISTTDNDPAIAVQGVDSTDQTQESVTFFGDFPRCNEATTPNPLASGKSFTTCLTFLVPGGIKRVAYTGTEAYVTTPVTWAVS